MTCSECVCLYWQRCGEHNVKFGVSLAAFVSFWFLSVLGGSWHFLKTLLLKAKHAESIARRVRLAALWAAVRGLRGRYRRGMRLSWFANLSPVLHRKLDWKLFNFYWKPIPKFSKMVPRSVSEEFWGASRLGEPKSANAGCSRAAFWCHLVDFGCRSGAQLSAKGSQNRAFWHHVAKNDV